MKTARIYNITKGATPMGEFRIKYHPANDAAHEFSQLPFQNLTERILEVVQGLEIPEIAESLSASVTAMEQYSKFTKQIAAALLSISESYFSAERTATEGFNELEQLTNAVVKQAENLIAAGNSPPAGDGIITNPENTEGKQNELPPNISKENSDIENNNLDNEIVPPAGNISSPHDVIQTPKNDTQPEAEKIPWVAILDAIYGITAPGYSAKIAAAVAAIIGLGVSGAVVAAVTALIQSILDGQLGSGGGVNATTSVNNGGANSDLAEAQELPYTTGSGVTALPQIDAVTVPSGGNANMYETIAELGAGGGAVGAGVATFAGNSSNVAENFEKDEIRETAETSAVISSNSEYQPHIFSAGNAKPQNAGGVEDIEKIEKNSSFGAIPIVGAVGAAAMAGTGFGVSKSGNGSNGGDSDIGGDKAVEIAATKSGGTFSGDLSGSYVLLTTALSLLFSGGSIGAGVRKNKDVATDGFRIGYDNSAVINADSIKQRWG
jgi:hypothetical protein